MTDTFRVRVRLKSFKKITPIEGGRYKRSWPVRAELLSAAEEAGFEMEFLAGFALVCWDDEGVTFTAYENAKHSPVRGREVPKLAKNEIRAAIDAIVETAAGNESDDNEG